MSVRIFCRSWLICGTKLNTRAEIAQWLIVRCTRKQGHEFYGAGRRSALLQLTSNEKRKRSSLLSQPLMTERMITKLLETSDP
ncbi:hypothetical protein KIN20_021623 [Parelaphostrongylus tenuis]|uniref:Uncharacterized protein n=1 Tax=Parelaphostrongylus tenuis TaxID=148309 RepID=A0AAD5QUB3_PARTN|nr:hypothetical protein KIN20_021623 [Parelaphostrongylus tenuis]